LFTRNFMAGVKALMLLELAIFTIAIVHAASSIQRMHDCGAACLESASGAVRLER